MGGGEIRVSSLRVRKAVLHDLTDGEEENGSVDSIQL